MRYLKEVKFSSAKHWLLKFVTIFFKHKIIDLLLVQIKVVVLLDTPKKVTLHSSCIYSSAFHSLNKCYSQFLTFFQPNFSIWLFWNIPSIIFLYYYFLHLFLPIPLFLTSSCQPFPSLLLSLYLLLYQGPVLIIRCFCLLNNAAKNLWINVLVYHT